MFCFLQKKPLVAETSLSKFIRHASSGEKKRVYTEVMKKATDRQTRTIEEAAMKQKDNALATEIGNRTTRAAKASG